MAVDATIYRKIAARTIQILMQDINVLRSFQAKPPAISFRDLIRGNVINHQTSQTQLWSIGQIRTQQIEQQRPSKFKKAQVISKTAKTHSSQCLIAVWKIGWKTSSNRWSTRCQTWMTQKNGKNQFNSNSNNLPRQVAEAGMKVATGAISWWQLPWELMIWS